MLAASLVVSCDVTEKQSLGQLNVSTSDPTTIEESEDRFFAEHFLALVQAQGLEAAKANLPSEDGWTEYLTVYATRAGFRGGARPWRHKVLQNYYSSAIEKGSLAAVIHDYRHISNITAVEDGQEPRNMDEATVLPVYAEEIARSDERLARYLSTLSALGQNGCSGGRKLDLIDFAAQFHDPEIDNEVLLYLSLCGERFFEIWYAELPRNVFRAGLFSGSPFALNFFESTRDDIGLPPGYNFEDELKAIWMRLEKADWQTFLSESAKRKRSLYEARDAKAPQVSKGMFLWCFDHAAEKLGDCVGNAFFTHFRCIPYDRNGRRMNIVGSDFYNACRRKGLEYAGLFQ